MLLRTLLPSLTPKASQMLSGMRWLIRRVPQVRRLRSSMRNTRKLQERNQSRRKLQRATLPKKNPRKLKRRKTVMQ